MTNIRSDIRELENYLGFPVKRKEITLQSDEPYDETLSYGLCQRFYGKDNELKIAIEKATDIIRKFIKQNEKDAMFKKEIALFFSSLGDMYYIASDFTKSINCYLKALSYNKLDITNWVGLMFSLRADGKIIIFESIIFNLEEVYNNWIKDFSNELNKEKIDTLLRKIKQPL